ncbi:putative membrane protein [Alkalibacillus filiformis]|uniref:Membrane protein n=1 Tax=Alkalibacillus filiformis TaxID=200990 RepID=A0ABU0DY16_9BACI|nr:putative membrane protein [Alkalibacillus filiformis]
MIVGFALSNVTIHLLLTHFRAPTLIFFVGIIVGFLPMLWQEGVKQAKRDYRMTDYIVMALFIAVVVVASLFSDFNQIELSALAVNDVTF